MRHVNTALWCVCWAPDSGAPHRSPRGGADHWDGAQGQGAGTCNAPRGAAGAWVLLESAPSPRIVSERRSLSVLQGRACPDPLSCCVGTQVCALCSPSHTGLLAGSVALSPRVLLPPRASPPPLTWAAQPFHRASSSQPYLSTGAKPAASVDPWGAPTGAGTHSAPKGSDPWAAPQQPAPSAGKAADPWAAASAAKPVSSSGETPFLAPLLRSEHPTLHGESLSWSPPCPPGNPSLCFTTPPSN